jgi:hypothetical protein
MTRACFRTLAFPIFAVLACLLAAGFATPAHAERDTVHFAQSVHVEKGSSVHDVVCFFCDVIVDGAVEGDIVAFFGSVRIRGEARHDVVDFFGGVDVTDNASIHHDVVNFFGTTQLGENATIGRDTVVMFGSLRHAGTSSFGGDRVLFPGWVFWGPVGVICLIVWLAVHELRGYRRRRMPGLY